MVSAALTGCASVSTAALLRAYEITLADASSIDTTETRVTANRDAQGREAELISAFYGLDDGLPAGSDRVIWAGAAFTDGMPVVFSHEIDFTTMQAGDFVVTTSSGRVGEILAVTLAPADGSGELRTVLFSGSYGSIDDQPIRVDVVGNLLSIDGALNFKGTSIEVTPLEVGPTMVWAEIVPEAEWDTGRDATPLPWGGGSGAPAGTTQVVRVTWNGGVTKPGGDEIDDAERVLYRVAVLQDDGTTVDVIPFAIADLGDGDNNHELCLDVPGTPVSVFFPAGHLTDPREDLNPDTTIDVTG